jgi:hypothetical protein
VQPTAFPGGQNPPRLDSWNETGALGAEGPEELPGALPGDAFGCHQGNIPKDHKIAATQANSIASTTIVRIVFSVLESIPSTIFRTVGLLGLFLITRYLPQFDESH